MTNQIPALTSSLPTTDVGKALGVMMLAYRDRSDRETAAAYMAALSHLPADTVCEAISRFVKGLVDRKHAFAPSATEIAAETRRLLEEKQASHARPLPEGRRLKTNEEILAENAEKMRAFNQRWEKFERENPAGAKRLRHDPFGGFATPR